MIFYLYMDMKTNFMKHHLFKVALFTLFLFTSNVFAQSVEELQKSYSGKTDWNEVTGKFTFISAGIVTFEDKGEPKQHFWNVPKNVNTIVIESDVRVVAAFHTQGNVTIKGKNRKTSMVYGTDLRSWAQRNMVKAFRHCQFQNLGGVLTIQNLTSLNPFGFHVRGEGNLVMVSDCDFIDNRGGAGNHSDGIEAGDGSVIDNCYFETGDDIIKAYNSMTVKNCTINMVQNAVPIQLGWGNTGDDTVNFYNLTIIGNSGRANDDNAIIVGRSGAYTKTINIYGCNIINPNASWISLRQKDMTINGEVDNAKIDVKKHWAGYNVGESNMIICGSKEEKGTYGCVE